MSRSRSGFTLLEVTIACALVALIAGIATLSLRGQVSSNQLRQALEQLERADRFARQLARRSGTLATIEIDEAANKVLVKVNRRTQKTYSLPGGSSIATVRQAKTRGREVMVSPVGQSPSYAVEFSTTENQSHWLVVAGTTGHTLRTTSQEQVDALLRF